VVDDIKMVLRETLLGDVEWIDLAKDRNQGGRGFFEHGKMNHRIS
jgi:hypothetical protein